jgi:WD40 repeat protein
LGSLVAGEIFISYRRADEAWARLLHSQLRREGVEAWYDALVEPGEDWRISTAQALEASRLFVLLFSENAAQSSDIAKELAAAVLERKLIVPVRLQNIAPKGAFLYELASRNWVNAYEDTETRLAELAKGLAHLVKTGVRDESLLPFERTSAERKRSYRSFVIAGAALAVFSVSAIATWQLWPARKWTVESSRPFISTLALEDFPAFSPNGTMLAYTSGVEAGPRQIYVRNLTAGESVRVTNDAYDDTSPAWSSDGARLAYVAVKRGEPCRIMVTTVPAGEAREAGRCQLAEESLLAWQPGTPFVYGVEHGGLKGAKIFRLNLDTGAREIIVTEPAKRDNVTGLRCSPDGKWLIYLLRGQKIILRDLTSGRETELGDTPRGNWHASLAWTEDSLTVLAGITSDVGGSEIIAHPLDGRASYSIYTTANKIGNFATGGGLLALETDVGRSVLARASSTSVKQPDIVDPASGLTWSPSFAPDGTLAFLSNRSGTNAIWIMKPGMAPTILVDTGLSAIHRVRFSPDGTKLAVSYETPQTASLKIMTRAGANLASFDVPSLGLGLPTWTLDGKAILNFDRLTLRTMRIPVDNYARSTPFAPPHWVGIAVRNDGTFATRADKPGIWRIDGEIRLVNDSYPAYYDPPLAFRGNDVLVPEYSPGEVPRILAQPVSGGPSREIARAPGAVNRGGFSSDLAVNPVTNEIIYTAEISRDTNIELLKLSKR